MDTTRQLYQQKYEAQIHEWSAKLDQLKARSEKLSAQAKIDAKPRIDAINAKLETVKTKLHEIEEATEDKWDDVMRGADNAWTDFKSAVEGAYDTMKSHKKN